MNLLKPIPINENLIVNFKCMHNNTIHKIYLPDIQFCSLTLNSLLSCYFILVAASKLMLKETLFIF